MPTYKQELIYGIFWSAVEKYSGLIVSIIVSMILARILSPEEYGVIAIATVFINFLQMFCTVGIGPAVIQKDLSQEDLDSIYTFSLILGIICSSIFIGASWTIADFYNTSELKPVCQILSIQVLFSAINMVPNALMAKNKKFKEIAKRTLILQISSSILSIIAAYKGFGIYALLISPVISSLGIFFWNKIYINIHINWKLQTKSIKKIFSYSLYQFLFEFINYFSRNIDKLIIGRLMSIDELGIYEKSYRLMQLPIQNISAVINPVLQPILRNLQDDKQSLSNKYIKIIKFVATISFPIGIILACMAKETIYIFFGDKWEAAVPIFKILALSLPLQMILSTSGSIYLISNNTKMQFWLGIRNTITTLIGFLIASFYFKTLIAMAWAWTITLIINFIITFWLMYQYIFNESILSVLKILIKPIITSIILAIILICIDIILPIDNIAIATIIKGTIAISVTLFSIQVLKQSILR